MLRCTYYNPNRVMTAGYLHAVGVTFLSLQFVCVVQSAQLSDVNITAGHRTECYTNKKKDAPTRMLDVLIYRALSLVYIITIIIVPLSPCSSSNKDDFQAVFIYSIHII